jgi:hypothetical protein
MSQFAIRLLSGLGCFVVLFVGATAQKEHAASIFRVKEVRVIVKPGYIGRAT